MRIGDFTHTRQVGTLQRRRLIPSSAVVNFEAGELAVTNKRTTLSC